MHQTTGAVTRVFYGKKGRAALGAALLALALSLGAGHRALASEAAPELPKLRVKVTAVRQTVLSSQLSGRLDKLSVRDGEFFSQGQVLAQMDCSVPEAQLKQARAAEEKYRSLYNTTVKLARLNSRSPLEVAAARAEADQATAQRLIAQTMVRRCSVTAPFPGRVAELMVRENQFVAEGQPLFEVLDPGDLELEFIAPSFWLPWFAPGYGFSVLIDETGQSYKATLTRLSGKVDPVSQSIKAYARLDSPDKALLPGMSGAAYIDPPAAGN